MWDRVIIHSDMNHCYAQIEELLFPELQKVPMVVGRDENTNHGIVLAENNIARQFGIETGELLRNAYIKCPELVVIQPHYEEYFYYTEEVKNIYQEYTDRVESFGVEEAWIDITSSQYLFGGNPIHIAKEIQKRIYNELGLTVSMGISFNKIFAKLGNDFYKKREFTVISRDDFQDIVFPLSVDYLFCFDKYMIMQLKAHGLITIGDIAKSHKENLKLFLGKNGEMIWNFANGLEVNDVLFSVDHCKTKSLGNGITSLHNISTYEEVKDIFSILVESVATKLKEQNLKGSVISIHMRDSELNSICRQQKIEYATNISQEIMGAVEKLLRETCMNQLKNHLNRDYRSVSVSMSHLVYEDENVQQTLCIDAKRRKVKKCGEIMIKKEKSLLVFDKFKHYCEDFYKALIGFNPKELYLIHSEDWFK